VIQIIQLVQIVQIGGAMFLLNLQSKTPIYEQIQEQILKFIEVGVLKPGDRLPSVRQMAVDNGINPNTVAKAYAEMEKNGYVYNLPKKGVYVAEVNINDSRIQQIRQLLIPLKENGITKEELLEVINGIYKEETC
jgi:GntR family transcriptional regulator